MNHENANTDFYSEKFEFFRKIEKTLATSLGLSSLDTGFQVIRNNKGWRENEKMISYCWIVTVSRSFVGGGGLFAIKFNEHIFREQVNKEEVVQGVFSTNEHGVAKLYHKTSPDEMIDFSNFFQLNLTEANSGITLDGVGYAIKIMAPNIDSFIQLNNPNTAEWRKWEAGIGAMGKAFAIESNDPDWIELFS